MFNLNVLSKLQNFFVKVSKRSLSKELFRSRKSTLLTQIDFLIDTMNISTFDIMYMENLKMPLTPDEKIYFLQQIDRLNSSVKILQWMRNNVESNETFWTKLLRW